MASRMTFQFLDVGMGDGTLVQIRPEGQAYDTLVLVDFGEEKSQFKVALQDALTYMRRTVAANSKGRGSEVPYIDYLFITHSDADHHNKLSELVKPAFPGYEDKPLHFGAVYYGGVGTEYGTLVADLEKLSKSVSDLRDQYHARILPDKTVVPDFEVGDIKVYILSVNYPSKTGKTNPKSIVLMFDLGGQKVILQGDAEKGTEGWILKEFGHIPGFLEVVGHKLGHHGSNGGTSPEWVAALKPKAIFASGDFNWAHPYCNPICRVLAGNTLAAYDDLWYCCGHRGEYFNNHHSVAVCMNLWYFVKSPKAEPLIVFPGQEVKWAGTGVTFGVQWALQITAGAKPSLLRTDAVIPYDVLKIPPGWDCSKKALRGLADAPTAEMDGEDYFTFSTVPPVTL
ncbi:MAG TPA: hypothetical protein VHG51_12445 [Longimicrobiaceae bacterium]|nr:hypothetical protein [Longimicrobiaceae bacterium]